MKKGSEIGLQDLLFNGAVGCLLLFIIFAIKVKGSTVIDRLGKNGSTGNFQATSSMPLVTEELDGKMVSYRRVIIKRVADAALRKRILSGKGWNWEGSDDLIQFVGEHGSDLIISVGFTAHPANLVLKLNIDTESRFAVSVDMIEGSAIMRSRIGEEPFSGVCYFDRGKFAMKRQVSNLDITFALDSENPCSSELITFR